jgi:hypothetical protein
MMVKIDKPREIYQLHIMLLKINPPIWRRILVRSDSTPTFTIPVRSSSIGATFTFIGS